MNRTVSTATMLTHNPELYLPYNTTINAPDQTNFNGVGHPHVRGSLGQQIWV